MKKSTVNTAMIVFVGVASICAGSVLAQQKGGGDWSQGFPDDPAKKAQAAPPPPPPPPPPALLPPPAQAAPAAKAAQGQQPAQGTAAAPAPAPAAAPTGQQVDEAAQPGGGAGQATVKRPSTGIVGAESSMRLGIELSAGALAAAPYLFFEGGKRPGEGKVAYPKDRAIYQRFDDIVVKPAGGKELPYKTGDTVDVLRSMKKVRVNGEAARVVARTGRGVVIGFAGKKAVVKLTDVWGKVTGSERVDKAQAFSSAYFDDKPADGTVLRATVLLHLDNTISPYMHQYLVVDKGSEAGVKLGDFFRVADKEHPRKFSEELIEAQAVNVTPKSSTLVIHKIYRERLNPGDEAFLSFRAAEK